MPDVDFALTHEGFARHDHRRKKPIAVFVALWIAFLGGLVGADIWYETHNNTSAEQQPLAAFSIGPTPLPWVAGVNPADQPLAAPIVDLEEQTQDGKLPRINANGQMPLTAYAYPFDKADKRPKVGVVLLSVGLESQELSQALLTLPGSVAFGFSLFTPSLAQTLAKARSDGHEAWLTLPAERVDSAVWDAGPGALRKDLSLEENLHRLKVMMSKASGYVGFVIDPNTTVFSNPQLAEGFIDETRHRGLGVLTMDSELIEHGNSIGGLIAQAVRTLDPFKSSAGMNESLQEVELQAKNFGSALIFVPVYPTTLLSLQEWLPQLATKGLALAPPSSFIPLTAAVETNTNHKEGEAPPSSQKEDHHEQEKHSPAASNAHE